MYKVNVRTVSISLVLLCLCANFTRCKANEIPTARELVRRAITYRTKFCDVGKIDLTSALPLAKPPNEVFYSFAFEGQKVYQSRRSRLLGAEKWSDTMIQVIASNRVLENGSAKAPVKIMPLTMFKYPLEEASVVDPRVLGIAPNGLLFLHKWGTDWLLKNEYFCMNAKVEQFDLEGAMLFKAVQKSKDGSLVSVWFAPLQGDGVRRIEISATQAGLGEIHEVTESKLKQYPCGIWYPERCEYTMTVAGKLQTKQVIEVQHAEFGSGVDDSTFTLSNMNLEPGREITDYMSGTAKARVWSGKESVETWMIKQAASTTRPQAAAADGSGRRMAMITISSALLVLGLVLIGRKLYRRRR